LSDELDIDVDGVAVLVDDVVADLLTVWEKGTGSSENRGLRGSGDVNDDGVESSRRCCALMIRLVWISKSMLGHSQLYVLCPRLPLLIAQREGGLQGGLQPWME
jgi:hypothetical protein